MRTQSALKPTAIGSEEKAISAGKGLMLLGIVFIALNLRAPLTSVGPLIGSIRESIGLSNAVAGTLTTVPLLGFALLSPFAPALARKFGVERVIFYALCLLTLGTIIRIFTGTAPLFTGTILLGMAIAICNVLLPSLVKKEFPHKVGLMTGIYAVAMNICGAIASGISVPLSRVEGLGWNGALGFWSIPAVIAIVFWLPQLLRKKANLQQTKATASQDAGLGTSSGIAPNQAAAKHVQVRSLWRIPLAWQVTLFMGLQSFVFYVVIAWFPQIMVDQGKSADMAGWAISYMQFAVLPVTFIVPIVAGRMRNQRLLVMLTAALFLLGIGGFMLSGDSWTLLWLMMIGVASGSSFSLAMMFFGLRTNTPHEAAQLSGMAQSVGYLLAAAGPTLFGFLHDWTGSWTPPLIILLIVTGCILFCGLAAGRNRTV